MAYKITDICVACGTCIDQCPVGAISEGDTSAPSEPSPKATSTKSTLTLALAAAPAPALAPLVLSSKANKAMM